MANQAELMQLARTNLLYFIVYMMSEYQVAPHHIFLCNQVQKAIDTPGSRLIVSLPPRHGKSTIISEFLPAFYFGYMNAKRSVMCASYGSSLAVGFGVKVRRHIQSPKYKALFPEIAILGNSEAGGYFELNNNSEYRSQGRGGGFTGKGAHLFIIDDLLKDSTEAASSTIREGCKQWYDTTAYSRLMPGASIIIVSTRWHEDDLSGYLLRTEPEKWTHLNITALCDEEGDIMGREIGEALWPEWYDIDYLETIKKRNAYQFSALYQGKPVAKEGNVAERSWLGSYEQIPPFFDFIAMAADTASTTNEASCYSSLLTIGVKDQQAYLLNIHRRKMKFPELLDACWSLIGEWKPDYLLIENASSGTQLIQMLELKLKQTVLIPISKQGDKFVKFQGILPILREGRLLINSTDVFIPDFVQELIGYPYAQFDDSVIALTHFLRWWYDFSAGFTRTHADSSFFKHGTRQNLGLFFGEEALKKAKPTKIFKPTGKRKQFDYARFKPSTLIT